MTDNMMKESDKPEVNKVDEWKSETPVQTYFGRNSACL